MASNIDYGPFDDDYRGFEIRDDESARGPLILVLALGVLLVFGAVVWNTYRQGVRADGAAVPVVLADAGPYKRVPDETGGASVPGTDKRFYDEMDASQRADVIAPARPVQMVPEPDDLLQGGPPIELRPDKVDMADADPDTGMPNAVADQVQALSDLNGAEELAGVDVAATGRVAIPAASAATIETPDAGAVFAFNRDGGFLVQVAAFRSEDAAETGWSKATAKHGPLFTGAGKSIQRADLGAKGVWYRLRVGAFDARPEAKAFCEALKAAGDSCIVVSR